MGNQWLTIGEFQQFQGRAGRLGKHERGKVVLLVEPGRRRTLKETRTEDEIALSLLKGTAEDVEPEPEMEQIAEQLLAGFCSGIKDPHYIYDRLFGVTVSLESILNYLRKMKMIHLKPHIRTTKLGRAASQSFLTPKQGFKVINDLKSKDPLKIAIEMEPFEAFYLSEKLQVELERVFKRYLGTRLFSGSILGLLKSSIDRRARKLENWVLNFFAKWILDFFNCECEENPFCDCGMIQVSNHLLNYRLSGLNPRAISRRFEVKYSLNAYPGDIYKWLDTLIHHLEGIKRIAEATGKLSIVEEVDKWIRSIERPEIGKPSPQIITYDSPRPRRVTRKKLLRLLKDQETTKKKHRRSRKRRKRRY